MDLGTVRENIIHLKYADSFDLLEDMHLIVTNSRKYFGEDHSIFDAARGLLSVYMFEMADILSSDEDLQFIKPAVELPVPEENARCREMIRLQIKRRLHRIHERYMKRAEVVGSLDLDPPF